MLKKIIQYFYIALFFNAYQHQLHGMHLSVCSDLSAPQKNLAEKPPRDLNQDLLDLGKWVAGSPIFTSIALATCAWTGGLPAAASVSGAYLAHKGFSNIPTRDDATAAKVAGKELLKEGQDTMVYLNTTMKTGIQLMQALKKTVKIIKEDTDPETIDFTTRNERNDIEYQQSMHKIKQYRELAHDVDSFMQNAPFTFESARNFIKELRKMKKHQQISLEQMRASQEHLQFKCDQAHGIFTHVESTTRSFIPLVIEANKGLETLERIYISRQNSGSQPFQARTLEEEKVLHQHRIAEGEQLQNTCTWTTFYATSFMQSLERLFTSENYRHNITHTKNNLTRTFASVASISVGGLLLYKHLANHVDHKSTILASIGAGLIIVPWIASYIDR